jgi:hypothetical protein
MENKDFTLYPEAFELKQLGFDEPCLAWATLEYHNRIHIGNRYKTHRETDLPTKPFGVPTYSQAFRWFREKYNLDSFVKHLYKSTIKVGYYFGIDQYKGVEFQMDFDAWYDTYEEAELACIKKLIELSTPTK